MSTVLGEELAKLRADTSKARWARQCKCTDQHIRSMEKGESLPSQRLLEVMFELRGTPPSDRRRVLLLLGQAQLLTNKAVQEYVAIRKAAGVGTEITNERIRSAVVSAVDAGWCAKENVEYLGTFLIHSLG